VEDARAQAPVLQVALLPVRRRLRVQVHQLRVLRLLVARADVAAAARRVAVLPVAVVRRVAAAVAAVPPRFRRAASATGPAMRHTRRPSSS